MACELRFYAWKVASAFSLNAHCPRCGNFNLEHISRERVESGSMITFKRWLGFPAYRCDPCRHRFFSVKPFRRILPSPSATANTESAAQAVTPGE
jgi:putative component of membrane protein insertase Oxa1/YidC/SpoIIIJ protein YidD